MIDYKIKQRFVITICLKLNGCYRNVRKRAQIFRWFKDFSAGRDSVEDEPRSGRQTTLKTDNNVERFKILFGLTAA